MFGGAYSPRQGTVKRVEAERDALSDEDVCHSLCKSVLHTARVDIFGGGLYGVLEPVRGKSVQSDLEKPPGSTIRGPERCALRSGRLPDRAAHSRKGRPVAPYVRSPLDPVSRDELVVQLKAELHTPLDAILFFGSESSRTEPHRPAG